MADTSSTTSFSSLHRSISHLNECAGYLSVALSHLEFKLRGFADEAGELPPAVKEFICRDICHDSAVAGFLFESLESIATALCRPEYEPDMTGGVDLAKPDIPNGKGGAA